ncbi:MAG TPA: PQQ-dependent sugar dehydrogenase [Gammaproteobacteria bacterium]|nr:PQQ-dependent sugar dehydrogenase [Gammaproteobacteria bacterium]
MGRLPFLLLALFVLGVRSAGAAAACDKDTGITLPRGFCATVFADDLGTARHMVVGTDGTLYVALQSVEKGGALVALRDSNGDGHADQVRRVGDQGGSGVALYGGYVYFATPTSVLRYRIGKDGIPDAAAQTVVDGFPEQGEHAAKSIAISDDGELYVNVGAPSNACQKQDRAAGSWGEAPCPLLSEHGGIWRFAAGKTGQHFPRDGERYATGIRNAVAITWTSDGLYAAQMGRDQLSDNWPKLYSDAQSAELPGEELFAVHPGEDFGWPYCYYDQIQKKKVQAPEYGGDGKKVGDCEKYGQPLIAFPGHWAPEALLFYSGKQFPAAYRSGAFVSFHGSWNRAPLPQAGFRVVFLPFKDGKPGAYQTFADGFAARRRIESSSDARYRPMGLAEGPRGSLYIGDTQHGRIWKVIYTGR